MSATRFVVTGTLLLIVGGVVFGLGWFGYGDVISTYQARIGWRIAGVVIGALGFAAALAGFSALARGDGR